jgi:hypothetical protein
VFHRFETDRHFKRFEEIFALAEPPNIEELEYDIARVAEPSSLSRNTLVFRIPTQSERGVSAPCRADREGARPSADIN